MQIAKCKLQICRSALVFQFAICILQFTFCNFLLEVEAVPAPLRHPAQVGRPGSNPASEVGLLYIPPATCFIPTQVNIYTGNGSVPVPGWNSAGAGARNANVSGLITGNGLIGHRQLVTSNDNYTHVLLLDPS